MFTTIAYNASEFNIFLRLGMEHLLGFDHILYIIALTATFYGDKFWIIFKTITAFTIGHSVTLLLSALQLTPNISQWVEFAIPITIMATAILNFISLHSNTHWYFYFITLCFGLIHGMGFASQIFILEGSHFSIINHLLAFNLGLEISQLLLVIGISSVAYALIHWIKILSERELRLCLSALVIIPAIQMIMARIPW